MWNKDKPDSTIKDFLSKISDSQYEKFLNICKEAYKYNLGVVLLLKKSPLIVLASKSKTKKSLT